MCPIGNIAAECYPEATKEEFCGHRVVNTSEEWSFMEESHCRNSYYFHASCCIVHQTGDRSPSFLSFVDLPILV